jgi:hypothetical protein
MCEIQILTECFASREQISWGYPLRQIPTDSMALADLGIKHRELFTVNKLSQSAMLTPTYAKSRLDEAVKVDIPSDTSCRFSAAG